MCDAVAPRQVTVQDKDLLVAVKDIIREDSRREKCAWTRSLCSTDTNVLISDALTAFLTLLRGTNYFSEDVIKNESFYLLVRNQMSTTITPVAL